MKAIPKLYIVRRSDGAVKAVNHKSKEQDIEWSFVHLDAPQGPMAFDIEVWTKRINAENELTLAKIRQISDGIDDKFTFEVVELGK